MAEQLSQVACLRFPKEPKNIVLPNVSVAEVIPYQAPKKETGPEWLLGYFSWRNIQVPIVSIELLNEEKPFEVNERTRLAVINRLSGKSKFEFFAVPFADLPTLVRVHADEMKSSDAFLLPVERAAAELEDQTVVIPDLEKIELMLTQLG
ncbi:chemotaxis protein CheW [Litoribacillus peritrichatus]|uniref:Chemotaxis protein CheW n=1 Tax=Litoribacillus peritrichatus TaxID=718191 RepID=A0ABP7MNM4_9GAMM